MTLAIWESTSLVLNVGDELYKITYVGDNMEILVIVFFIYNVTHIITATNILKLSPL